MAKFSTNDPTLSTAQELSMVINATEMRFLSPLIYSHGGMTDYYHVDFNSEYPDFKLTCARAAVYWAIKNFLETESV